MKIHTIQLETSDLSQIKSFYGDTLGLEVINAEPGTAHVKIGSSWLIFTEAPLSEGIYHFAVNIPSNQIRESMAWLERAGIALVVDEKGENQIDFASWNAEAAYFFDPAGNIVEFIARRDLQNESDRPFGTESLMEISEIGIVTDDVQAWNDRAAASWSILPFEKQKPSQDFSVIGTDMGLFIVVLEGRNWYLTDIPAAGKPVFVQFENDKGEVFEQQF